MPPLMPGLFLVSESFSLTTGMSDSSKLPKKDSGSHGNGTSGNEKSQYWYPRHNLGFSNFTAPDLSLKLGEYAEQTDPGKSSANDFNLTPFYESGAKLLHYCGHSDAIVPPGIGIYFHDQIAETLAKQGIDIDDFYKFCLIPGMQHCYDTPTTMNASWYIAGPTQASALSSYLYSVPGYSDAKHDILLALVKWVENGTAAEYIIGYHIDTETLVIDKQRPICAYPMQAKYKRTGDIDDVNNFESKLLY